MISKGFYPQSRWQKNNLHMSVETMPLCVASKVDRVRIEMPYHAIAYVSTAVAGLTTEDIDRLLIDARARNQLKSVTGVLLYDGLRFFQYLEGPEHGVSKIYARIQSSALHSQIEELFSAPVNATYFNQWYMACSKTDGSILQQFCTKEWRREAPYIAEDHAGESPEVLQKLIEFWNQIHPR